MGDVLDPVAQAVALKEDGNQELKAGNFAEAERLYSAALRLDPSVEAYWTNRALVRTKLNNTAGAIEDCNAALERNPASARAFGRLGAAHFSAGSFSAAAEAYKSALEIDGHNATYAQGLTAARGRASAAAAVAGGSPSNRTATSGVSDTADAVKNVLSSMGGAAEVMRRQQEEAQARRAKESINDATVDLGVGMERSKRAWDLFEQAKAEYAAAMQVRGTEAEKQAAMDKVHERTAARCLELARTNGGIYNKAAQFVASLQGGAGDRGVPKQYVRTLEILTDKAPFRTFEQMEQVLVEDLGRRGRELFSSIEEQPLAAASLAQVHKATTRAGEEVAVKMLYPQLRKNMASDFSIFEMMGKQIKPGGFDLEWLVRDFKEALAMELDFQTEAANSEAAQRVLARRADVSIPRVLHELSSKSVLTMVLEPDLIKVSEHDKLAAAHLSHAECGALVADVFYEMALVHGLVHGDPHAGNIYLRAGECTRAGCKPQLVVLDHGLYHKIPRGMRRNLCRLVLAQVSPFASSAKRLRLAKRFAGPLAKYFPLLLSPWFVFSASLTVEDIAAARRQQLPESLTPRDVGECLVAMHGEQEKGGGGNMLGVLHSMGYTRGLLGSLGFPERARLKWLVRHAQIGLWDGALQEAALAGRPLPLLARAQLAAGSLYVDVTAVLIPVLALLGPLLLLYSLLLQLLAALWRFGGLNILAWELWDAAEDDAPKGKDGRDDAPKGKDDRDK